MNTSMHRVSSITISKTDMETFGTVEVEVTTTDGERLTITCFHEIDAPIPITLEIGE
tara:strand:- start:259 stop:429 length:171 start_codon:yes stop_codon:yes gene_type:complete